MIFEWASMLSNCPLAFIQLWLRFTSDIRRSPEKSKLETEKTRIRMARCSQCGWNRRWNKLEAWLIFLPKCWCRCEVKCLSFQPIFIRAWNGLAMHSCFGWYFLGKGWWWSGSSVKHPNFPTETNRWLWRFEHIFWSVDKKIPDNGKPEKDLSNPQSNLMPSKPFWQRTRGISN